MTSLSTGEWNDLVAGSDAFHGDPTTIPPTLPTIDPTIDDIDDTADDLLAMSAHELRSPVAAIVGYVETIRTRRDLLTDEQFDDALETIARQAHRLDSLLQDILLLASGRTGLLHLRPQPVALREVLLQAVGDEHLDPSAVVVSCGTAVRVMADRRRLQQMVGNYLANARIHGTPPYAIEVTPRGDAADGAVILSFRDSGPGVAEAHLGRLFHRFERAGADPSVSGSGLGLAVVQTLAEASGGSASYSPGPPGGHRFVLQLPSAPPEAPEAPGAPGAPGG